ncbi:MAG: hypothetical protein KDE28_05940, partial [Anaerolineales bacterium]|nr:hypothetical protein [Anaerolineales bacterium]
MSNPINTGPTFPAVVQVMAGADCFGEHRGLGISTIAFKLVPEDPNGILIIENSYRAIGGPARHRHYDQVNGIVA